MQIAIVFECPACGRPVAGGAPDHPLLLDENNQISAPFKCARCGANSQVMIGRLLKTEAAS